MALNLVPLVLDFYDGGGNLITSGTASLAPSSSLVDATDNVYVTQSPIVVNFHVGASPLVEVIPTDNANIEPGGWAWEITFNDVPGSPEPFYFNIAGSGTLFSFTAAGSVFTAAGSSFANGTGVVLQDELSLPGGFWPNTVYYVVDASGATFGLASGPGGDAIVSTSSGSGTVALVQYLSSVTTNLSPVTILPLPVSSGGTGAVNAAGARANLAVPQVFSPMSYDAAGNGITDDTEAVTAAFAAAAAAAGTVDLGTYTFLTSSPVSMPSNITVKAASGPGSASGGSIINSVSDIFEASGVLECFSFQNVTLIAAAGHIFNCAANTIAAFGTFLGCSFTQGAAGKSIWYMPSGVYLNMLVGDETSLTCNASATAVPWYVVGQANSNTWSSVRVTAGTSVTVPFFQIETDSASTWSSGNIFRDITAEICVAGIVKALTVSNLTLENVLGYDVSGSYNASLIYVGAGTGSLRSQDITARNCGRVGGSLAGGAYDFQAASSTQAILLENVGPESGSASYSVPAYYTTIVSAAGNYSNVQSGSLTASGTAQNSPAQARLIGGSTATGAPTAGTWDALDLHLDSAGILRACTTPGTPGTWTAIGTPWVTITDYGASTSSSDNGSAINAAIAALTGGHGTVFIPPGTWDYTTQINLGGANNVRLVGGVAASGQTNTSLMYTGTGGSAAINATGSGAVCFENLFIEYSSTSFTGYLIDYSGTSSDTALGIISGCYLGYAGQGTYAAALVNLNHANSMKIVDSYLSGGVVGILGMNTTGSYANKITIDNCQFIGNGTHIMNAAQAWTISNNTFEACAGGAPGIYSYTNGSYSYASDLTFIGNWAGDITASSGKQINAYAQGLVITGNYLGQAAGTTAIALTNTAGVIIEGNTITGGAKGVDFGSGGGNSAVHIKGNTWSGTFTTGMVTGTIPADAVIELPSLGTGYGTLPAAAGVTQYPNSALSVGGVAVTATVLNEVAVPFGANLVSNPDFSSTSSWSTTFGTAGMLASGATLTSSSANGSADGSGTCGQVVCTSSAYYEGIEQSITGLAANTSYLATVYVQTTAGSAPQGVQLAVYDATNSIHFGAAPYITAPISGWTLLQAPFTTGASGPVTIYLAVRDVSAALCTFLVSAAYVGTYTVAPTVSPVLTGTPTAPTGSTGDTSTQIATDQFVSTAITMSEVASLPRSGGTLTGPLSLGSTNLISNPDFASSTTGWNSSGSYNTNAPASLTRLTGQSADLSGTCGQVVTNSSNSVEGVWCSVTGLAASTTYTCIAYVMLTSGSQAVSLDLRDTTNSVSGTTVSTANPCPATWTQLATTITTGASGSATVQVALCDSSSAACTFLISAVYFGITSQALSASSLPLAIGSGGTASTTASAALSALGALPSAGGTMTGVLALAGAQLTVKTKTGAYPLTSTDNVILASASSAAFTLSLPAASASAGQAYVLQKTDSSAHAVTVAPNGSDTIAGVAANSVLASQYDLLILVADGVSNWIVAGAEIAPLTFTSSPSWTAPVTGYWRLIAIGSGGAGGGGGSMSTAATAGQQGGTGGGEGKQAEGFFLISAGTVLTGTVGATASGGSGAAAGSSGNTGSSGGNGNASSWSGTGVSLTAPGGGGGYRGAAATASNNYYTGSYAVSGLSSISEYSPYIPGVGASSFTTGNYPAGASVGTLTGGPGSGGAVASASLGGVAGSPGTQGTGGVSAAGNTANANGGTASNAGSTAYGAGGGGGGGGATTGTGGNGGNGGPGLLIAQLLST